MPLLFSENHNMLIHNISVSRLLTGKILYACDFASTWSWNGLLFYGRQRIMMRRQSDDTESQVHPIIAHILPLNTNSKMNWKSYGTFLIANYRCNQIVWSISLKIQS